MHLGKISEKKIHIVFRGLASSLFSHRDLARTSPNEWDFSTPLGKTIARLPDRKVSVAFGFTFGVIRTVHKRLSRLLPLYPHATLWVRWPKTPLSLRKASEKWKAKKKKKRRKLEVSFKLI